MAELSKREIVLLGESHTATEHHLWQAQMLASLHAHNPNILVGFEAFPRAVQPSLERWSKGDLSESHFLENTRWNEVWRYDPKLYMPLFHFARQNRIPIIALNVERQLISRVSKVGWDAIPETAREGLTDPAQASEGYRLALAKVYQEKLKHGIEPVGGNVDKYKELPEPSETQIDLPFIMGSTEFGRFVAAQLTWDRAMAEAMAKAKNETPGALVIGVLGRGHIEHGYGVPHQLADLGLSDVSILLPVEVGEACERIPIGIADAVFLVDGDEITRHKLKKPKLGILIETAEDGVRVLKVMVGSIAEAAELAAGDIVKNAAGLPVKQFSELVEIIQRQAPGTWLPLDIRRGDQELEIVAKFPALVENSE